MAPSLKETDQPQDDKGITRWISSTPNKIDMYFRSGPAILALAIMTT